MADQVAMIESQSNFQSTMLEHDEIEAVAQPDEVQPTMNVENILQQAFNGATEGLDDSFSQYNGEQVSEVANGTNANGNDEQQQDGRGFVTVQGADGVMYTLVTEGADGVQLTDEQLTAAMQQISSAMPQSESEQAVLNVEQSEYITQDQPEYITTQPEEQEEQEEQAELVEEITEPAYTTLFTNPSVGQQVNDVVENENPDENPDALHTLVQDNQITQFGQVNNANVELVNNGNVQLVNNANMQLLTSQAQPYQYAGATIVSQGPGFISVRPKITHINKSISVNAGTPRTVQSQVLQIRPKGSVTLLQPSISTNSAPVGSHKNPIHIIQQGNQYTSTQKMTPEQLQQIMQVVQQQEIQRSVTGDTKELYNPTTKTRVIYKVLNPNKLHGNTIRPVPGTSVPTTTEVITKRPYRKRKAEDDDGEEKIQAPELSKEEKELRKKVKPRTRSGRISKPPKHMREDYKGIHLVEWFEEPYDDSDAGYSDYKVDSDDNDTATSMDDDKENTKTLELTEVKKAKDHKCDSCEKSYIGWKGLARHYSSFPDHGSLPEEIQKSLGIGNSTTSSTTTTSTAASNVQATTTTAAIPTTSTTTSAATTTSTETSSAAVVSNGTISNATISNDIATHTTPPSSSAPSSPPELAEPVNIQVQSEAEPVPRRGRGRPRGTVVKRGRGRPRRRSPDFQPPPASTVLVDPARRRQKLRELIRASSDEELMEDVLPRLARNITAWEFMVMKAENRSVKKHIQLNHLYSQFRAAHKQLKELCSKMVDGSSYQVAAATTEPRLPLPSNILQIPLADKELAASMGLQCGRYTMNTKTEIRENKKQKQRTYTLITDNPRLEKTQIRNRNVEVVSRHQRGPSLFNNTSQQQQQQQQFSLACTTQSSALCTVSSVNATSLPLATTSTQQFTLAQSSTKPQFFNSSRNSQGFVTLTSCSAAESLSQGTVTTAAQQNSIPKIIYLANPTSNSQQLATIVNRQTIHQIVDEKYRVSETDSSHAHNEAVHSKHSAETNEHELLQQLSESKEDKEDPNVPMDILFELEDNNQKEERLQDSAIGNEIQIFKQDQSSPEGEGTGDNVSRDLALAKDDLIHTSTGDEFIAIAEGMTPTEGDNLLAQSMTQSQIMETQETNNDAQGEDSNISVSQNGNETETNQQFTMSHQTDGIKRLVTFSPDMETNESNHFVPVSKGDDVSNTDSNLTMSQNNTNINVSDLMQADSEDQLISVSRNNDGTYMIKSQHNMDTEGNTDHLSESQQHMEEQDNFLDAAQDEIDQNEQNGVPLITMNASQLVNHAQHEELLRQSEEMDAAAQDAAAQDAAAQDAAAQEAAAQEYDQDAAQQDPQVILSDEGQVLRGVEGQMVMHNGNLMMVQGTELVHVTLSNTEYTDEDATNNSGLVDGGGEDTTDGGAGDGNLEGSSQPLQVTSLDGSDIAVGQIIQTNEGLLYIRTEEGFIPLQ